MFEMVFLPSLLKAKAVFLLQLYSLLYIEYNNMYLLYIILIIANIKRPVNRPFVDNYRIANIGAY